MTIAVSTATADLNRDMLRRAEGRERRSLLLLTLPGIVLVASVILLPLGVMLYESFIGESGSFSLENYARLWTSPVYEQVFDLTFKISFFTTLLVAIIGYPLTYALSQLPDRSQNWVLLFVLLPFWTPVLVRTYAWLVLLQDRGLINEGLLGLGLISQPLPLSHNMTGALVGMVQIMLPFLVLPLFASMKAIDPNLMAAASNLGAKPSRVFRDVFFPLSLPGFLSGLLIVFVLCLGFYVTPAVLGGGRVIMAAMRIDANVRVYSNWGAASALGIVLLLITVLLILVAGFVGRRAGQGMFR
ncbi:ABC transporter permease [Mesorhizobium sp. WSM4884]|uniref:ABC transporter permease n=1 Tax=Mesorhizobium sp. WSM4884 TaxID=3038542 RepID=UPI00241811E6|nr:ABC transporter permease [Mesorhizobium sp. WSM4884]MDG4882031.1 ABC transporter permease [Mesorhizobium sp. WSM4884]